MLAAVMLPVVERAVPDAVVKVSLEVVVVAKVVSPEIVNALPEALVKLV